MQQSLVTTVQGGKRLTITVMWQVLQGVSEKVLTETEEETCRRLGDNTVWLGAVGSGEGKAQSKGFPGRETSMGKILRGKKKIRLLGKWKATYIT